MFQKGKLIFLFYFSETHGLMMAALYSRNMLLFMVRVIKNCVLMVYIFIVAKKM